MKSKKSIALFLVFGCALHCMSQRIGTSLNEDLLKGRVKQIDEFMCRFNMTETWDGKKIADRSDPVYRKKYLSTLFNYDTFRQTDGKLTDMAVEFINQIAEHDYQIHYEDSTWIAEVACTARIGTKREKLRLHLHTQQIRPGEYKWVISNVYGKIFEMSSKDSLANTFISPMEHEIGFVGLLTLKVPNNNVANYMDRYYAADKLSMLAVLLGNGLVKIESIDKVIYHFYTIPGYAFTVERIEKKNSFNTGWLICGLNKLD